MGQKVLRAYRRVSLYSIGLIKPNKALNKPNKALNKPNKSLKA